MKDFSLIIDKVSQALGTTVDNVVKLYPQLRTEYSWYYLLDHLQDVLGTLILVNGFIACGSFMFLFFSFDEYEDEYTRALKILKWSLGIEILFVLLFVVAFVLQGFMCQDILIIERFIK